MRAIADRADPDADGTWELGSSELGAQEQVKNVAALLPGFLVY